jgi:hypothetical protein
MTATATLTSTETKLDTYQSAVAFWCREPLENGRGIRLLSRYRAASNGTSATSVRGTGLSGFTAGAPSFATRTRLKGIGMRHPSRDYEHGNLEAARVIVAEPWKAQGSAWLLEWARKTVARHDHSVDSRSPANKTQLFLLR